ncbi:MAG: phytanoyl-CoA dioxygenase family protein [Gemmatimonadaceae bacterium]|nr:phytanoyl-CoA dioxygenase family protein [Gemmatimonadaceae bacterium]
MNADLETRQYLFDLQGYLVVEDVLDAGELAALNELIDGQELPDKEGIQRFGDACGSSPEGPGFLQWGQPFCDLLDHERILPILRFRLGDCFRLDRIYGIRTREGSPRGFLHSDYGASAIGAPSVAGERYHWPENVLHTGFVVVSWNLTDAGPGHGGFCCVPGSHKSVFRIPEHIQEAHEDADEVILPSAPAGSVTLFTEAITHGTAAWRAPHERRCLLYKYCVSQIAWSARRMQPPEGIELTPRQQILFRDAADPHRYFPSLFD